MSCALIEESSTEKGNYPVSSFNKAKGNNMRDSIAVSGIWLRWIEGMVQVLAEVDGKWRLLMEEPVDGNPTFSHIYEPSGIRNAPFDPLGLDTAPALQ